MSTTLECRCRSEGIGVWELGWQALGMFLYIMWQAQKDYPLFSSS